MANESEKELAQMYSLAKDMEFEPDTMKEFGITKTLLRKGKAAFEALNKKKRGGKIMQGYKAGGKV